MSEPFWVSDARWAALEPLLRRDTRGVPRVDDRGSSVAPCTCCAPVAAGPTHRRATVRRPSIAVRALGGSGSHLSPRNGASLLALPAGFPAAGPRAPILGQIG